MHGQMYVEVLTPRRPHQRYPLVLVHGAAQTATNWMGTPDGHPGWADYFVAQGYTVYLVDQPARSRSPWLPDVDGKLATFDAEAIESRFTAQETPIYGPRQNCIRNGRVLGASATPYSTPSMRRKCRIWPMAPRPSG